MKDGRDAASKVESFDPAQFLTSRPARRDAALIILNSPIGNYEHFIKLYKHADCVVCADGGANRLFDLLVEKFPDHAYDVAISKFRPTAIHGDLDSISDGVRQAYAHIGVAISQDQDQYSTDFQKALKRVLELMPTVQHILVLGSTGGRVDQGVGLLHELYREQSHRRSDLHFWLFTEVSVSFLLPRGRSRVRTEVGQGKMTRNMGLLPIYGPATISTTGLEWDVKDWPTSMGGNVSTSNHIVQDAVDVVTDHEILFTVELSDGKI